jgi:hypothetical protein
MENNPEKPKKKKQLNRNPIIPYDRRLKGNQNKGIWDIKVDPRYKFTEEQIAAFKELFAMSKAYAMELLYNENVRINKGFLEGVLCTLKKFSYFMAINSANPQRDDLEEFLSHRNKMFGEDE